MHGYDIAQRVKQLSEDVLEVGESSCIPRFSACCSSAWVKAQRRASESNRRARYYTLTVAGRRRMGFEPEQFDRVILAINKVLNAT